VFGDDEETFDYTLAKCCNPIPGDDVFGFLTVNDGIKVHKKDCPNAIQLQSNYAYRILKAKWIDSTEEDFNAKLKLSGIDNLGLVSQVTDLISKSLNVNMKNLNFSSKHGIFNGEITVTIKNKKILNQLIDKLKKIDGIDKVSRE
jgi:GTP pyrophosphokinase